MKKRYNTLAVMLIITVMLVACLGGYLKYAVLEPYGLYQDESIIAIPFLLMSDDVAREELRMAMNPTEPAPETEPSTEPSTQPSTEPLTEPPTEPPTELPTEPIVIDESWFDDALFIGDSRTQHLYAYAPLGTAHYFCETSMSVFDVWYREGYNQAYGKTKLEGLISKNTYGKVYIMLGINGVHRSDADYLSEYQRLIDYIREKQPDAVIVLQSIMTVGRYKAASEYYFSLEHIYHLNEEISKLADGEKVFYIDINEWAADEEGYLPSEMSKDGCHLYVQYNQVWADWLMEEAADFGIR